MTALCAKATLESTLTGHWILRASTHVGPPKAFGEMMEARRYALTTVSRSSPKTGEPSGSRTSIETVSPKAM